MLFNTWTFALFFVVFFVLYVSVGHRTQNVLILIGSYVFYGWWDYRFLALLLLSTVVDFVVARRMARGPEQHRRKLLLVSLTTNLGILALFKYFDFFIDTARIGLQTLGMEPHLPLLAIVLPVGISFYTFQTMAYTIDVYRRRMEPVDDPVVFGVYVSYFPQLVAGPIERAQNLIPQFEKPRVLTTSNLSSGALLVAIGLLRKVAIADVVAGEVDKIFGTAQQSSSLALIRAVVLFSIQIYGDFAGYTDVARGISRMLGIELMENFNHPYFAVNITSFWRRWHISLSTWLRDYLYISLGGNRGPRWFVYRNLLLTMLLGGLWHGAAWTFVVWGGLHGLALSVHKLWLRGRKPRDRPEIHGFNDVIKTVLSWALTMAVVGLAWVFFRAPDFQTAFDVLEGIWSLRGGWSLGELARPAFMIALLLAIDVPQYVTKNHTVMLSWPWPARGLAYAALVLAIVLLRTGDEVAFIYFQF